ncbi:MAG: FtsK/SpoIIIE domain-containing protein [Actinophytocola sp.]|uniref:FtsK/SpoIIIE domain-containing protein n=1 Tax=Actinophytocola sp. TaxID=1872138 RepID=UPI003C7439D3
MNNQHDNHVNDRDKTGQAQEVSNVRYLPHHHPEPGTEPGTEIEVVDRTTIEHTGPVFEGEIVSAAEYNARQKQAALERWKGYQRDVVTVYKGARTAVTHQRTRTVARHLLAYPVAGAGIVWRRWRDAHGVGRYERQMRAAEAAGDQEAVRYWQEADVAEKDRRHRRVMDWMTFLNPWLWIKYGTLAILGFSLFLLVIGIITAINTGEFSDVIGPIGAVLDAIAFTVWFVTAYGVLMLTGATTATLFYLYSQGRKHAEVPAWLAPVAAGGEGDVMDELPDENTIVNALRNLNIPGFTRALKEGWRVKFQEVPHVDGKGWRAQLDLPPACPVEEIVKRKNMLAHNLVRFPIEVWPTEPRPSVLDLWVAKPGALSGPVDPWPLLADLDNVTCDYFKGVPVGVTVKGDVVRGRLFEANYVLGGMMGSGKSTMVITLLLGAMLDPLVDIDVVVMAENADYEPMARRLRSLTTGVGEETVETCLAMLAGLYEEISVRGQALKEHDARAVTRELAEKDDRLRPRIMVIDECQNLFIGKHGAAAIEVAAKLMSSARKYAITLMFLTPEPSKDALPRKLISIASNKACYAIGDHQGNDAVLGSGSYKQGISAVGLTPKTDDGPGDVGTCMQRGFTGKPGLLRTFYVGQADAHRVTERALQLRDQRGITATAVAEPVARDPLADIAAVLGDQERMRTQDVLQRLTHLARAKYSGWTFTDLHKALPESAKPYKSRVNGKAGVQVVSRARVREAIAERDENSEYDTAETEGSD